MTEATKSYVAMFQGAIALLWTDGELDAAEKEKLQTLITNNTQLSSTQKQSLTDSISQPIDIKDVWEKITDAKDRAHLINIANMLFWADGAFCHSEQELYAEMQKRHLLSIGEDKTAAIELEIQKASKETLARIAIDKQKEIDYMMPHTRFFHYLEEFLFN